MRLVTVHLTMIVEDDAQDIKGKVSAAIDMIDEVVEWHEADVVSDEEYAPE